MGQYWASGEPEHNNFATAASPNGASCDFRVNVSGMGGTAAGIGTIIAFKLVGHVSDAHQGSAASSFDWILIAAGLIPFVGMLLVLLLVRNTRATEQGLVRPI